jgi:hypothetical protein
LISVIGSYVDVARIRESARKRRYLRGAWIGHSQGGNTRQNQADHHERKSLHKTRLLLDVYRLHFGSFAAFLQLMPLGGVLALG